MPAFSAAEYKALVEGRKLADRTREIGYDLFVRGHSPAEIRARYAITPSRLHGIRRQIETLWLEQQHSDDWILETLVAPRRLLEALRRQVAKLDPPSEAIALFEDAAKANSRRGARKKR
jgi:hypothetical protein